MIQPLRNVHRAVFVAWAFLVPVVFAGGLLKRHRAPVAPAAEGRELANSTIVWERTEAAGGQALHLRLLRRGGASGEAADYIQFASEKPFAAVDLLVYWSATAPSSSVPEDAALLGAFQPGASYRLPANAQENGYAILYSPARQETAAAAFLGGRE